MHKPSTMGETFPAFALSPQALGPRESWKKSSNKRRGVYWIFYDLGAVFIRGCRLFKMLFIFLNNQLIKLYSFETTTCCACKRVRNEINLMLRIFVCTLHPGCGVYSRTAFINILALGCGVYSRAAFIRWNTVSLLFIFIFCALTLLFLNRPNNLAGILLLASGGEIPPKRKG